MPATHIQQGQSLHRSWCGLAVTYRMSTDEDDYRDKVVKGVTGNICKNCIRSLEANR